MPEELRALNEEGRRQYREWLEKLRDNPALPVPATLLKDPASSFAPVSGLSIPPGPFATKLDLATALLPIIEQVENRRLPEDRWPGVWDGLALAYFDEICPVGSGGNRSLKALERYMFTDDYLKRHRHRILGPVYFYRSSAAAARLFLSGSPKEVSDQEEQIGSRQELGGNASVLDALAKLYWDSANERSKRGWAPNSQKPGTLRRFVVLTNQLSRTFDLSACSPEALISLLPAEFDKWRKVSG